jgi:CDP-diglyceride synthetase
MAWSWFIFTLYAALPAFCANMAPVFAARWKWFPSLAVPIYEKYLGSHKTWRGVFVAVITGSLVGMVQALLISRNPIFLTTVILFGALSGFGAMLGDALKSAIKRALGIAPGAAFIPFDYIDYIAGMIVCTLPVYAWSWQQAAFLILFVSIANPAANAIGYFIGIKKTYW